MQTPPSQQQSNAFPQQFANINQLWATLFIEELVRNNIRDFCIAPGSRSTPLTLAVANRKDVNTHLHFDERGLGFLALGLSQASKKPVVIITTSGTAVANLYPAVIEARQSRLPLIIISADRPAPLLHCGANQAIEQYTIFANYPVFFRQLPMATLEIKPSYLLTTINQGLAKQQSSPAPIHFNIAFAEPLYPRGELINYQDYLAPLQRWLTNSIPFTSYIQDNFSDRLDTKEHRSGKKVLIITGRLTDKEQALQIARFAKLNHYPLFADIQSSLAKHNQQITYYDLLLLNPSFATKLAEADIIIQFGDQLISKRLGEFIAQFAGEYWLIQEGNQCIDPHHQLQQRFNCTSSEWIKQQSTLTASNVNWLANLIEYDVQITENHISPLLNSSVFCEINITHQLGKLISKNNALFIGNSLPIRIADMFMSHDEIDIFTNRGASGIDGLIATAIGVAKNHGRTTTLLLGDTSFLYDLNSLALLKQLHSPFIIVVINNDGGAIFNLLPVPEQHKQRFYQLPHGLTFADTCKQFAIDYYQPAHLQEFQLCYQKAVNKRASLIEICVKNEQTSKQLEQLKEQLKYATFL